MALGGISVGCLQVNSEEVVKSGNLTSCVGEKIQKPTHTVLLDESCKS